MSTLINEIANFNFNLYSKAYNIPLSRFPTASILQNYPTNVYLTYLDNDENQLAVSWNNNFSIIWQKNGNNDFWKIIYYIVDNETDQIFPKFKVRYLYSYSNCKYIIIGFVDKTNELTVLRSDNYGDMFINITSTINNMRNDYSSVKYRLKDKYIYKALITNNFFYIFQYDITLNQITEYNRYISLVDQKDSISLYDGLSFFDIDPAGNTMVVGIYQTWNSRGGIFYTFDIINSPPITNLLLPGYYYNNDIKLPENFQCCVSNDGSSILYYDGDPIVPNLVTKTSTISLNISPCFYGIGKLMFTNTNNIVLSVFNNDKTCENMYTSNNRKIYLIYNGFISLNNLNYYLYWNSNITYYGSLENQDIKVLTSNINLEKINTYLTKPETEFYFYNDGVIDLTFNGISVLKTGIPSDDSSVYVKPIKNITIFDKLFPKVLLFNNDNFYIISVDSNNNLTLILNLMNTSEYNSWCRQNCSINSNQECTNLEICLKQYKNYCNFIKNYAINTKYPEQYNETDPRCICIDTKSLVDNYFKQYSTQVQNTMLGNGNCVNEKCTYLRNDTFQGEPSFPINYTDVNCAQKKFIICNTTIEAGGNVNINGFLNILQNCGDNSTINITNPTTTPTTIKPTNYNLLLIIFGSLGGIFLIFLVIKIIKIKRLTYQ